MSHLEMGERVKYEIESGKTTINSRAGLVDEGKGKMNTRLVYATFAVLVLAVVGLVVALIIVASQKDPGDVRCEGNTVGNADSQTGVGEFQDLPEVDCSYTTSNLAKAKCVLDSYPLIDGHNDLPVAYLLYADNKVYSVDLAVDNREVWVNKTLTHTDIPRLRRGQMGTQFWANFAFCDSQYKDAVRVSLEQQDVIKKFVRRYSDTFQFVTSAHGVLDAFRAGKIGSMVGLEGGHSIDSSLGTLRMFYDLGVRYMTLTHSCNTPWADNWRVDLPDYNATAEGPKLGGLTEFGKKVVLEMNRLGMLVDLSHVAKATMMDALETSRAPVIFSHSSTFSMCNNYRNAQDDVLLKMKENGGVIMVIFYDGYINCPPNNQTTPTLQQVADHIEYIRALIGVDFIGIGSDYNGIPTLPEGLGDVSTFPALFAELVRRGWNESELQKLAGRNLVRVLRQAERVRDEMAHLPPYEDWIPENENSADSSCRHKAVDPF